MLNPTSHLSRFPVHYIHDSQIDEYFAFGVLRDLNVAARFLQDYSVTYGISQVLHFVCMMYVCEAAQRKAVIASL